VLDAFFHFPWISHKPKVTDTLSSKACPMETSLFGIFAHLMKLPYMGWQSASERKRKGDIK